MSLKVSQPIDNNSRTIVEASVLTIRQQNDSSGLPIYIGVAVPGSATSSAVWQIRKFTYSDNFLTSVTFADGDEYFDNVWDNRASLSYS